MRKIFPLNFRAIRHLILSEKGFCYSQPIIALFIPYCISYFPPKNTPNENVFLLCNTHNENVFSFVLGGEVFYIYIYIHFYNKGVRSLWTTKIYLCLAYCIKKMWFQCIIVNRHKENTYIFINIIVNIFWQADSTIFIFFKKKTK